MDDKELAKIGFEAYNKAAGGKTHDGKDIPSFDQLVTDGKPQPGYWEEAAKAIREALGK